MCTCRLATPKLCCCCRLTLGDCRWKLPITTHKQADLGCHYKRKMASATKSAILTLLIVTAFMAATADVVELTDATFTDKVKEQDTLWFIKFFAPWCGHCKNLAPIWKELGQALEGEDNIEIASVDCTTSKATCTKADIRAYPTLKVFYNGEELKKYQGPRDLQSLKAFATETAAEVVKAGTKEVSEDVL